MAGDPFAPPPHRPDHPDFAHLSEIMLQLDGVAVELGIPDGEVLPHEVGKHADVESVVYMAVMRAIKAKEQSGITGVAQVVASAMWMDGWIAGVRFQQRYRQGLQLDPEDVEALARLLRMSRNLGQLWPEADRARGRRFERLLHEFVAYGRRRPIPSTTLGPEDRDLLIRVLQMATITPEHGTDLPAIRALLGRLERAAGAEPVEDEPEEER